MSEIITVQDLETLKKHEIFEAEVLTGKVGGLATGANIDYATNAATGQVQKTMPAILRDIGFEPASFDFTTGGTLGANDRNKAVLWPLADGGDGDWYNWEGALPKVVPAASTPYTTGGVANGAWRPVGDITLREELAAESGASLVGFVQGGTGAIPRASLDKMRERISVSDMGAVGGGADDTLALKNAITRAFSIGAKVVIDKPIYITELLISSGSGEIACEGTGMILPHDSALQTDIYDSQLLKFDPGVTKSVFSLEFDMRGFSKSACSIQGNGNYIPYFRCENIQAIEGRTNQLWCLSVQGSYVKIGHIESKNVNSVDSMMSGGTTLAVVQYALNTEIDTISSQGGFCAFIGNGENTTINHITCQDSTDNVIYSIAASKNFVCHEVIARNCVDEVVVFSGDVASGPSGNFDSYVGKVICYDCGRGVGFYKTTRARVGIIEWYVSSGAVDSGSPLYMRPTQTTHLDSITVEELRVFGTWKTGAPLWSTDRGSLGELSIGKVFARLVYDDVTLTRSTALTFTNDAIDKVRIGDIDVVVADGTGGLLTSAHIFRITLPAALTKASVISSVKLSNNGGTHQVRLVNPVQNFLTIGGVPSVRNDLNPPHFYSMDDGQLVRMFSSGQITTQGTWKRGDIVFNNLPSAGGFVGWVCVAAGTPGTWKGFGAISA